MIRKDGSFIKECCWPETRRRRLRVVERICEWI